MLVLIVTTSSFGSISISIICSEPPMLKLNPQRKNRGHVGTRINTQNQYLLTTKANIHDLQNTGQTSNTDLLRSLQEAMQLSAALQFLD